MTAKLRADKAFTFGGRKLLPGDMFHVEQRNLVTLVTLSGMATVVEDDNVEPEAPVKRGRGRPKGSYKTRDMTAEP